MAPTPSARPLPCPSCGATNAVRAQRLDEFDLFLEPTSPEYPAQVSDRPRPLARGENRLQFACQICGQRWVRVKDFEAACARAGNPIAPFFP
jgi:predicted RNA-binding Zn-ribbon protein involved in translation (DUF1610 family)